MLIFAMIQKLAPRYGYGPDDIKIDVIGLKPGEKLYEELMSDEEMRRSLELSRYFAVLPAFRGVYHDIDYSFSDIQSDQVSNPYVSAWEASLSVEEIVKLLEDNNLLDQPGEPSGDRYWPGDKEERD